MAYLLLLTVVLLFGMEDRANLNSLCGTWVSKFNVKSPLSEVQPLDLSFISEISLFVLTDIVLENTGVDGTGGFVLIEDTGGDRSDFKDLIFIGSDLYLELYIFTESNIGNFICTLMDSLQDQ